MIEEWVIPFSCSFLIEELRFKMITNLISILIIIQMSLSISSSLLILDLILSLGVAVENCLKDFEALLEFLMSSEAAPKDKEEDRR